MKKNIFLLAAALCLCGCVRWRTTTTTTVSGHEESSCAMRDTGFSWRLQPGPLLWFWRGEIFPRYRTWYQNGRQRSIISVNLMVSPLMVVNLKWGSDSNETPIEWH